MTRKIWMNFAVELTVNSATVLSAIQCSQVRWAIDKSIKHQSCVVKTQKLTCKPHKRALQFTDHQLCILDLDNDFPFQSNHHFTPSRRWIASYCSSHEIWLAYSNALAGDFHEDSICSMAAKWEIDQKVTSSFLRDTHAGIEPTLKKETKCILGRYQRVIKGISVGATRRICFYGKIQREFDYLTSSNHS